LKQLARTLGSRLRLAVRIRAVASGPGEALRAIRAAASGRGDSEPGEPVGVGMKALRGEKIFVRPGTSDLSNAVAYYERAIFMPPPGIPTPLRIVELGTNCGVAITALGVTYPQAKLLGVEADPENVTAARLNTERFGDRCEIVEGAIWDETTELTLVESTEHGAHGTSVRPTEPGDSAEWGRMAGTTIDDLLDAHLQAGENVDYMHVSIEGTEPRVFAAGGRWPERVLSIKTEVHPYFDYEGGDCVRQLEELGYRAWIAPDPPDKWVLAVRR